MSPATVETAPAEPAQVVGAYVWWCAACGRQEPFSDEELERFTGEGWPACCGQKVNFHYLGRRLFAGLR